MQVNHYNLSNFRRVAFVLVLLIITAYLGYVAYLHLQATKDNPGQSAHINQDRRPHPSSAPESRASGAATPSRLMTDHMLTLPLPVTETLAKDEISKLDDIQQRLLDQQNTLKQQIQEADQLLQLKQEQITILEQQLAMTDPAHNSRI